MKKLKQKRRVDARIIIGLSIFAFAAFSGKIPEVARNTDPGHVQTVGAKQAECDRNSIKTQFGTLGCTLNSNRANGTGVRILRLMN